MSGAASQGVLFLHIPKTAGVSLLATPVGQRIDQRIHPSSNDVANRIVEAGAQDFFKFSIVRNPFDRMVSLYHYFAGMDENHPYYQYNKHFSPRIRALPDFASFCAGFEVAGYRQNFHFHPQTFYTHPEGEPVLDFRGRFETLEPDLDRLADVLGVSRAPLPKLNSSARTAFRDYYDSASRAVVERVYASDLKMHGYGFDD